MQDQDKQLQKLEVDRDLAALQLEKERKRLEADEKKQKLLDMMMNNIKIENDRKRQVDLQE